MADASEILKVRLSTEGIEDVMNALKKVQTEVGKTGDKSKSTAESLGALGTIFAARQIAAFAANAIDVADGLGKMSQKTGIAVEQLSVLTFMGQQADLTNQDLEKGLIKLAKSFDLVGKGDSATIEAFKRIGVSAEELKGLSLDQVLLKVANAQSKFADGAGKAAVMVALLGKSGANMIPFMNDLAGGGFEKASDQLQKLGTVITTDMAKKSQDFNDSMKRLEMAAQGATVVVAQTLLPSLTAGIDGMTTALGATPAPIKAFTAGTLGMGAAATGTIVAVRMLWGALAGMGAIGIAVVAISAMISGVLALQAASDQAQEDAVKNNEEQANRVKRGAELVEQYKKEAEALKKGNLTAGEAKDHEEKLKKIKDELIKISPAYKAALDQQTGGLDQHVVALEKVVKLEADRLANQKKQLASDLAAAEAHLAKTQAESDQPAEVSYGGASSQDLQANQLMTLPMRLADAKRKVDLLKAQLQPLMPDAPASGSDGKKDVPVANKEAAKADAAARLAEVKRFTDDVKQANDAQNKDYEDMYARGLIDLKAYLEARKALIEKDTQMDIAVIRAQINAELATAPTNAITTAEKMASATKIADLEAQILAKKAQGEQKLRDLQIKGRDEAEKNALETLKLEAEVAQAKGLTGEAGIRAIEAEENRKIQLENDPKRKALLTDLKGSKVNQARLGDVQKTVDLAQSKLDLGLGSIDAQQGQGLITEEESIRRKIELYQTMIPVLEEAAVKQMMVARSSGKPEDLLHAQENVVAIEKLKGSLKGLSDQVNWVGVTARNAFQEGLGTLLMDLTNQTTTLTQKILALGKAIAQALLQQATARMAASFTTYLFGPAPAAKASGGAITGPGTGTSDSVPIWASNGEYMIRAAAVDHYGAGLFHALNGMHFPKGTVPGFAQGGLIGGSGPAINGGMQPLIGSISIVVSLDGSSSKVSAPPALEGVGRAFRDGVVGVIVTEMRPGGKLNSLRG